MYLYSRSQFRDLPITHKSAKLTIICMCIFFLWLSCYSLYLQIRTNNKNWDVNRYLRFSRLRLCAINISIICPICTDHINWNVINTHFLRLLHEYLNIILYLMCLSFDVSQSCACELRLSYSCPKDRDCHCNCKAFA